MRLAAPFFGIHRQGHTQFAVGRHRYLSTPEHLLLLLHIAQAIGPGQGLFLLFHQLKLHPLLAPQHLIRAGIVQFDSIQRQVDMEIRRVNIRAIHRQRHIFLAVIHHAAANTDASILAHFLRHRQGECGLTLGIQGQLMLLLSVIQLAAGAAQRGAAVIHGKDPHRELLRSHRVHLHIQRGLEGIAPEYLAISIG